MASLFNSFTHATGDVHNGVRAVRPEEIADDCAEARAALAKINERVFDGERIFTVSPGHAAWLATQLREAGWLVEESGGRNAAEVVSLLLTKPNPKGV